MADVQKVKDAFFNKQVRCALLCEVFCEKTNDQLKKFQEEFANDSNNSHPHKEDTQPVALTQYVTKMIADKSVRSFLTRVLADPYTRADLSERENSTSVDTTRAEDDAAKLKVKKLKPEVFLDVFLGEGGSMTFSQVKETVDKFGGEDDFIEKLEDSFGSPFQDLCVRYIEFALKTENPV